MSRHDRHATRARAALAHLPEVDPALAVLALWCRHRDTTGATRTAGETVHYGPGFDTLPLPQQIGLAAHHIFHVALRHSARARGLQDRLGDRFDPSLFGLAADAIVNETLILAGHALPRPCVTLMDLLDSVGQPAPSPHQALSEWDTDRLAIALHRDEATRKRAGAFGQTKGFDRDIETGEDGEDSQAAADWRGHVLRALEAGRQAGAGVGTLGSILADLNAATVPWERQLRGLLTKALSVDPRLTWRRPASRWVAMEATARDTGAATPAFAPGIQRHAFRPRIVVGLDTSSSIDPLTLGLFAAEAAAIARRSGAEAHLLAFDDTVHFEMPLGTGSWEASLNGQEMLRGGGTDFTDLMQRAAALDPSILVVLTDLDAPFPPPPRFRVLWATPVDAPPPPFGTVLRIVQG